jgi:elongation factor G
MVERGASGDAARARGARLIALVGPSQCGKTTVFEAILAHTRAIDKQGSVRDGSSVGDASPEARAHRLSVEPNFACVDFLGDRYAFADIPGSPEFSAATRDILPFCDAAIVVCDADARKLPALYMTLRELEALRLPHLLFLNKIDAATLNVREALALLQPASKAPLLLRQIPIWRGGVAIGFIDLALERAYVYREHAASEAIDIPGEALREEKEARYSMMEKLADYDDALMEELLADLEPPRDQIFDDLAKDLCAGLVAPLFIGSAERGAGITRLLKALRHEAPGLDETRARLGIAAEGPPLAGVLRTLHNAHGGKQSLARILRGSFTDGLTVTAPGGEDRIASLARLAGAGFTKSGAAEEGETYAFGRLDHAATGDLLACGPAVPAQAQAAAHAQAHAALAPLHAVALVAADRKDEMRLAAALTKLSEEDPSLSVAQDQQHGELRLGGQGEMHLRVALERLAARFGVSAQTRAPSVGFKETIRHTASVRARHKKQSGGHGQYGDVALEIAPRARGEGFAFIERIHGGVVPKNYFGAIEAGCRDALAQGPLGFEVVDVEAVLTDGSFHSVDSSDMAFRIAARMAMTEALAKAGSYLLEPVMATTFYFPSEALSRVTALASARRAQILGFGPRDGWDGWDALEAQIPEADMDRLIVELRSATAGVGYFDAHFDHLAEIAGRSAREAAQTRRAS